MHTPGTIQFQDNVRRLLSRKGKPLLKPSKPLVLKDSLNCRQSLKGEATCITEMMVMMACWKQNNFIDSFCSSEITTFYTCVKKAEAARKNKSDQDVTEGRLSPKQATVLLKRFPNPLKEI